MRLVKISSERVQIRTDLEAFQNVRINDLMALSDGTEELVVMVTALSDTDSEMQAGEEDYIGETVGIKTIDGAILGSIQNGKFQKAIHVYPTTSVEIRFIDSEEFSQMLSGDRKSCFPIGRYTAYDCPAFVDGNRFFQRHACIVGNTGSGKSETVAKILEETAKLPGANVIVFDIHGEYSKLSYASNIRIGEEFPFPVWMFGFTDIVSNILKIKEESATTVTAALRKAYYQVCPEGKENRPVYFDYHALIRELERMDSQMIPTGEYYKTGDKAGMPKTTKGEYNGKLTGIINLLKDKTLDSRYSFLFCDRLQSYLYEVMEKILGAGQPVKNIDLSGVPHDVAIPMIGVITRLVFDIQKQQDMDCIQPVTIVCDEAHVYIPDNYQLSASQRRMVEVFEDIAKEGRKFGITLFPATQRPSELNRTILAQCANLIVGKLNNENDKALIKNMLPDGSEALVDSVTMFQPGQVLVIGDAAPIPLKIQVELAKERPVSRTVYFWDAWKKEASRNVEEQVDRYLSQ